MFIIKWIINWFKKKKVRKFTIKKMILQEYEKFLSLYNNKINFYFPKDKFNDLIKQFSDFKKKFNYNKKYFNKIEKKQITDLFSIFSSYKNHEQFNKDFIKNTIKMLPQNFFLFKNINLDHNQITSIVKEDKINLVIAGAGSGKTTTILGKIKYLVEICNFNPAQILVLSYSVKSVEDFNDRIKKYLEYDIEAKTIHGFSYLIARQTLQQKHSVANENTRTEAFMKCLNNDTRFVYWWSEFIAYYWDQKITDSEIEAIIAGKKSPSAPNNSKIVTLNNEKVKSSEEARIANFLFLNGIKYKYEEYYEKDTWTESYVQYKPDFYLTDYKIYWEHFGFDKNQNTMWKNTNPTADANYKKSWKWKIKLHEKHNTKLIQTFSYELQNNNWKELLINKLKSYDVNINPTTLTKEQLHNLIKNNKKIEKVVELFDNLMSLYEEHELNPQIINNRLNKTEGESTIFRTKLILNIFFAILKEYNKILKEKNMITFSQMIKKGQENLKNYQNPYQYLIIDEFQDISPLRMKFINQLIMNQKIKNFYFVGDDWQSIFGFNGSRVQLFTNLLTHPKASVSFINNTYRNSQELINIASEYITKDKNMIKKSLKSKKSYSLPIRIYDYQVKKTYPEETNQAEIIAKLVVKHYQTNKDYQFLILYRIGINKEQLWINKIFSKKTKNKDNVTLNAFPEAKIKALTIHDSKGLEADFVFVLHASDHLYGLPCQITNDPICSIFDVNSNEMTANEERRLFYVALTRTKNIVYLLTESENHSSYIDEISNLNHVETNYEVKSEIHKLIIKTCTICNFKLKSNNYFVSCPNYKICGMTIKKRDINNDNKICILCKWIMVLRTGQHGSFYKCVNINCNYKVNAAIKT